MTKNQIEYWKLRWQQYYDMLKLQLEQQKLQLDWARHKETKRSNRAQETIKWSELNLNTQKFMVQTVLDNHKAYQEYLKIAQKDIDLEQDWKEISMSAEKLLMSKVTMKADLAQQLASWTSTNTRSWISTSVQACGLVGKILGEKEVASLIGAATAEVGNQELRDFYSELAKEYPEYAPYLPEPKTSIKEVVQDPSTLSATAQAAKDYVASKQREAEDGGRIIGFSNTKEDLNEPGNSKDNVYGGVQTVKVGSTKSAVETSTADGTRVIYSPGTHDGPGFNL